MPRTRSRIDRKRWIAGAALLGLVCGVGSGTAQSVHEGGAASVGLGPNSGAPWLTSDPPTRSRATHPPELPADALLVPLVRQEQTYSCGPAVLASVLRYFRVWDGTEQKLYQPLGASPTEGTLPEKLAEVAGRFGLLSKVEQPMTIQALRDALRDGRLVILELQAWPEPGSPPLPWSSRWDDGHYVVLIALDDRYAYFMDPSTSDGYTYLELDELGPRWHDVNPVRDTPLREHDYQLGVVIGKPATSHPAPPAVWPAGKFHPLRRLE